MAGVRIRQGPAAADTSGIPRRTRGISGNSTEYVAHVGDVPGRVPLPRMRDEPGTPATCESPEFTPISYGLKLHTVAPTSQKQSWRFAVLPREPIQDSPPKVYDSLSVVLVLPLPVDYSHSNSPVMTCHR